VQESRKLGFEFRSFSEVCDYFKLFIFLPILMFIFCAHFIVYLLLFSRQYASSELEPCWLDLEICKVVSFPVIQEDIGKNIKMLNLKSRGMHGHKTFCE
jgi:hypothetical protein